MERVWEDGGGAGAGHIQCQESMQEGSKETGYTEKEGGSERPDREGISVATSAPASLPFHLHNHPLRSVLVSHPLWGEETEAQGGYGAVHRHSWSV